MWKSDKHRLTPEYGIFNSFLTLVKYYHVTSVDGYDKTFKTSCQRCNEYIKCAVRSKELLYTNFLDAGTTTLGLYT